MLPHGDDNVERTILVSIDHVELEGTLGIPKDAAGVVLFAHGSGSSRFSPRNRYVARVLRDAGFATLLLDLLSPREEEVDEITRHHRFDIGMLADRLIVAIDWLESEQSTAEMNVGLFGASTGAAAALVAAAERPRRVSAVVSRGGRPDLAGDSLAEVEAPTLLIVGENDDVVIQLNEEAKRLMRAEVRLDIVPNATHLFEEPGALEEVARLARHWFSRYLISTWHSQSSHAHSSTTGRSR
jgi:dienelactone hydrolase